MLCAFVGRSVTDSGMALTLCQMISERNHQPSARSANANSHGWPRRSFCLVPAIFDVSRFVAWPAFNVSRYLPLASFAPCSPLVAPTPATFPGGLLA